MGAGRVGALLAGGESSGATARTRAPPARVLAAAVAAACGGADPPPLAVARDSAGVRIVEHGPDRSSLPTWSLASPPEMEVGDETVGPAHQLTEVMGAVRLPDGRVVVGDRVSKEARFFSPEGVHLRTVGGEGEGPGELRFLYHVDLVLPDTVVLGGWPVGIRTWFDGSGRFVDAPRLGPWFPGLVGRTTLDGSLLVDQWENGSYGNTIELWAARGEDGVFQPEGVLTRVSRDGAVTDTLGPMLGEARAKRGRLREDFALVAYPFTTRSLVGWSAGHVFIGRTDRAELRAYAPDGRLARIVRWSPAPVPVTGADRAAYRRKILDNLRPRQRRTDYVRLLDEIAFPPTKPVFDQMLSDAGGRVWVRDAPAAGAEAATWVVYGEEGAVARVLAPPGLRLVFADETHVLGVRTDAVDLEYLGAYRIER